MGGMERLRVEVLGVKHMNHFIVREYETNDSQRYSKLEKMLQKSYGNKSSKLGQSFKVGSYVAVFMSFNGERGPKLWLRGVIRENYHQKDFLFGIYFGDYGFDKTCHKSELRELIPYHCPEYVPFQSFNLYLTDVDYKSGVNKEDVLQEIRNQFEAINFVVSVIVEGRGRKGCVYGSILVEEDCDLAAILLEKQLVIDVHYCKHYVNKKSEENSNEVDVNPRLPGPFRSGYKACRANCHSYELICKCDALIKYKRKLLRDKIKIQFINKKKSSNERYVNSV